MSKLLSTSKKCYAKSKGTDNNINVNKPIVEITDTVPTNHIDRLLPDEVLALVVDLIPLSDRVHHLRLVSHRWKAVTELTCRTSVHRLLLLGRSEIVAEKQDHGQLISTHLESYGFEDSEHCGRQSLYRARYVQYELKLSPNQALDRRTSCAQLLHLFPSVRSLWLVAICLEEQCHELAHLLRVWGSRRSPIGLTELTILNPFPEHECPLKAKDNPLWRFLSAAVTEATVPQLTRLTVDSHWHFSMPPSEQSFHHLRHLPKRLQALHHLGSDTYLHDRLLQQLFDVPSNSFPFPSLTCLSLPSSFICLTDRATLDLFAERVFPALIELTCSLIPDDSIDTILSRDRLSSPLSPLLGRIDSHCTPGVLTSLRVVGVHDNDDNAVFLTVLTQRLPRVAAGLRRLRLDYHRAHRPWPDHSRRGHQSDGLDQADELLIKGQSGGGIVCYPDLELLHLTVLDVLGVYDWQAYRPSRVMVEHLRHRVFPSLRVEIFQPQKRTVFGASSLVVPFHGIGHFASLLHQQLSGWLREVGNLKDLQDHIYPLHCIRTVSVRLEWRQAETESPVAKDHQCFTQQGVTLERDDLRPVDRCHVRMRLLTTGGEEHRPMLSHPDDIKEV